MRASTVTQTTPLHYTRGGVVCGFAQSEERPVTPRLGAPVPAHLGHGSIASEYAVCEPGGLLQKTLRKLVEFNDPRVHDLEKVVLCGGRDGVVRVGSGYDADKNGSRFQWRKQPNSVGAHGDVDEDPKNVVEEHGVCLSYDRLYAYKTKGDVDPDTFGVSDMAADLPRVFLRLDGVSEANEHLRGFLNSLLLGHAQGVLTVSAVFATPSKQWSSITRKLQNTVSMALGRGSAKRKLLSLFTLKSVGGVRAAFEMCLRRRVLLRCVMCNAFSSKSKKRASLLGVGLHECRALWDAYASTKIQCVRKVWTEMQKKQRRKGISPEKNNTTETANAAATAREKTTGQTVLSSGATKPTLVLPDDLPWDRISYDCRDCALDAMAEYLNWKSILPPVRRQHDWLSSTFDRYGAKKCEWRDLNIPQILQCTRAKWREEVSRAASSGFRLLVTNTVPEDCELFDGVLYLGDENIDPFDGSLLCWRDTTVTAKRTVDGVKRKYRDTWVVVDRAPPRVANSVVCMPLSSKDAEKSSLLVRLFPLVQSCSGHTSSVGARVLHPHIQKYVREHRDQCQRWMEEYEDEIAMYKDRLEWQYLKLIESHVEYFETARRQYDALLDFTYPGCNAGCQQLMNADS